MADDDMFDDDDAEMQRLRANKNFKGVTRPKDEQKPTPVISEKPKQTTKEDLKKLGIQTDENAPALVSEEELAALNLPTSFGTKSKKAVNSAMVDKTKRAPGPVAPGPRRPVGPVGPARPSSLPTSSADDSDSDSDSGMIGPPRPAIQPQEEEEDSTTVDEDSNFYNIPYSHEITLAEHDKLISSIDLDPAGGRVISGGFDYKVKFWDFAGMDAGLRSFRTVEPVVGSQIMSLQFSLTGDRFLVAAGNSQAKIFNRDGYQIAECIKGDMYLSDMNNTAGHISSLGNAMWSPTLKDHFITSSLDGTVRIWDSNTMNRKQKSVAKARSDAGRKVGLTYASYSPDGSCIVAGAQDGSIQIWSSKGPFSRPNEVIRNAHKENSDITCLTFSSDNYTLVSRAMDDSMKIWDIRNIRKPLAQFEDLPNFGETKCIFSPDDRLILTGTSVKKGEGTGLLVFYDKNLLTKVKQIGVCPGASVVCMNWHPKINQILVGCSDTKVHVFYDPKLSNKGALLSVIKAPRRKDPQDYEPSHNIPIITPNSLPLYREEPLVEKRKAEREKFNPKKNAKLEAPAILGPGKDGKLGSTVTQHLLKTYIKPDFALNEDPREAILRYKDVAEKDPMFFKAYEKTQPKPIFDEREEQELGRVVPKDKKDKKKD